MEMNILDYVDKALMILVPTIYILGILLKKSYLQDWLIPWILLGVAIVLSILITGNVVMGIIQGVLIVGVCVLGNQLLVQTMYKR